MNIWSIFISIIKADCDLYLYDGTRYGGNGICFPEEIHRHGNLYRMVDVCRTDIDKYVNFIKCYNIEHVRVSGYNGCKADLVLSANYCVTPPCDSIYVKYGLYYLVTDHCLQKQDQCFETVKKCYVDNPCISENKPCGSFIKNPPVEIQLPENYKDHHKIYLMSEIDVKQCEPYRMVCDKRIP